MMINYSKTNNNMLMFEISRTDLKDIMLSWKKISDFCLKYYSIYIKLSKDKII